MPFVLVRLNAGRSVSGILRGFDPYMNLVLDDCVEEKSSQQKFNIGMVVSGIYIYTLYNIYGYQRKLIILYPL